MRYAVFGRGFSGFTDSIGEAERWVRNNQNGAIYSRIDVTELENIHIAESATWASALDMMERFDDVYCRAEFRRRAAGRTP